MTKNSPVFPNNIVFIGCGNMGGGMLSGWLAAGLDPAKVTIFDPFLDTAPGGITVYKQLPDNMPVADLVILAVKPQKLAEAAPILSGKISAQTIIVSILAGIEHATLIERFGDAGAVIRLMPNMAVRIGQSVSSLYAPKPNDDFARAAHERVEALAKLFGSAEWLAEEAHMHVATALAGSGPAFVFRFVDALAAAGQAQGLDAQQAERFALAMVQASAQLASASQYSPDELARQVASPGGTTQAGLDILDEGAAMQKLVDATIDAAAKRSAEMAKQFG
jgi:pyrroline-5-carboxylate reductase